MIPAPWKPLLEIRQKGFRPEVSVIVSICGDIKSDWPVLVVPDDANIGQIDFRLFVGLDVIIAHVGRKTPKLIEVADALVQAQVKNLEAWDVAQDKWVSVVFQGNKIIREVPPMEVPCG